MNGDTGINWQPRHLEAELVRLVPLQPGDFEVLYQVASDPLIWDQHPKKDRYKREVFVHFFDHAIRQRAAFLVLEKSSGTVIGSTGYYDYKPQNSSVIIGYSFLARKYWGGKYNAECKRLLLDHAFQFVNLVYFHIGAGNRRSQVAIERTGARKVGELIVSEQQRDYEYCIEKKDWLNRRS